MNINVADLLNGNYILLLFVVLALGLCLGKLRLGSVQLGNSIGVLVVSLLLGQQHFAINTDALNLGFMLFIFCVGVEAGYNFLHHAADDSFPSDHGTVSFTFALAFLFWHRLWSGALLMAIAAAIAWSRVYLGVHWPLDMVGGLLAGMCGCLGAALIWHTFGPALYHQLQRLYRLCFSLPIRKGWVRG